MLKKFIKHQPGRDTQYDLRKVIDNIALFVQPLENNPILSGALFEDIEFTAGTDLTITHGLGKVPQGYVVVRSSAATSVFDSERTATDITLQASADATISIWIF